MDCRPLLLWREYRNERERRSQAKRLAVPPTPLHRTAGGTLFSTPSDRATIAGLLRQDMDTLAGLYDRHSGVVLALMVRILGSSVDAEALATGYWLSLWRGDIALDLGGHSLEGQLIAAARALALLHRRARHPLRAETSRVPHPMGAPSSPPAKAGILELAYYDGLGIAAIADQLALSPEQVKRELRLTLVSLAENASKRQLITAGATTV